MSSSRRDPKTRPRAVNSPLWRGGLEEAGVVPPADDKFSTLNSQFFENPPHLGLGLLAVDAVQRLDR